ncbi:glycoside hydrolase family 2 TIM barrel-domain containing protein, partial [Clavibacter michiganensis]|uniref:glycoside hydrolase family 2 TIM barrel-domain containing protein n=1 Tax=Clavibacter michiganensis TaxID=28447 RepID=UPI002931C0B3
MSRPRPPLVRVPDASPRARRGAGAADTRHDAHAGRGGVDDEGRARQISRRRSHHRVRELRASHHPPHPRVLDRADELGFWVID